MHTQRPAGNIHYKSPESQGVTFNAACRFTGRRKVALSHNIFGFAPESDHTMAALITNGFLKYILAVYDGINTYMAGCLSLALLYHRPSMAEQVVRCVDARYSTNINVGGDQVINYFLNGDSQTTIRNPSSQLLSSLSSNKTPVDLLSSQLTGREVEVDHSETVFGISHCNASAEMVQTVRLPNRIPRVIIPINISRRFRQFQRLHMPMNSKRRTLVIVIHESKFCTAS
jgi:hypothetical protein